MSDQIFVPSTYVGGPCAIIDTCDDGSCGNVVNIVETNSYGIPKVYQIELTTLNALVDNVNKAYNNRKVF